MVQLYRTTMRSQPLPFHDSVAQLFRPASHVSLIAIREKHTAILGFLGYSAAEAAYQNRCGSGGAACVGTEGRYVDSSDVLRR